MIRAEPPVYRVTELAPRRTRYAFLVICLNEGDRLRNQLRRMRERRGLADIVLADGDSSDGSTDPDFLTEIGVRALLVTSEPGLGTAIRMGLDYALAQGYEGVITVDGNGKDSVEDLPAFLRLLDEGYDCVQGSRFLPGGKHENTPAERYFGVRYVVAPLIGMAGGYRYSDPTNGFKGLSRRYLTDPRVQPLRRELARFNLQFYLNCRAPQLGLRVTETPVTRVYPADGAVPTKITSLRAKLTLVAELLATVLGRHNPRAAAVATQQAAG